MEFIIEKQAPFSISSTPKSHDLDFVYNPPLFAQSCSPHSHVYSSPTPLHIEVVPGTRAPSAAVVSPVIVTLDIELVRRRVPQNQGFFRSPLVGDMATWGRRKGFHTGESRCCSPSPTSRPNQRWPPSMRSLQSIPTPSGSWLAALRDVRGLAMATGRLWRRASTSAKCKNRTTVLLVQHPAPWCSWSSWSTLIHRSPQFPECGYTRWTELDQGGPGVDQQHGQDHGAG